MPTTRESLEAALAAEPENVALHSAYADLLIEEGDPRGEYIRLELMLEDEVLTEDEREELQRRTEKIRTKYEREWLGPLYRFVNLIDSDNPTNYQVAVRWKRGWLEVVHVSVSDLRVFDSVRRCAMNRLIRVFHIVQGDYYTLRPIIQLLLSIPFRVLILEGFESIGDRIPQILSRFLLDHRKFSLNLNGCGITDEGARLFADSPHIRNLLSLNLDSNYLSPIGIAALAEVGFAIGPQLDNPAWDGGADAV
jgi:uncharacterized protein (TIGR02996 family)